MMAQKIRLKKLLDFAAQHYPAQTRQAVLKTFRQNGMRGLGASDLPDLSYLQTGTNAVDVVLPNTSVTFTADGVAQPAVTFAPVDGTSGTSISDSIFRLFDNLTKAAPNLLTAYTANQQLTACAKTNQARLSQGLSPVDCSSFAPQVQVGVAPNTQKLLTYGLIGGAAILALFLFTGKRHHG